MRQGYQALLSHPLPRRQAGPVDHVVILDGTLSSLLPGEETNAGLLWKLLRGGGAPVVSALYQSGIQWQNWRSTGDVVLGRGIGERVGAVYGALACRYRPGDRIFLFGYSRGAFAALLLAALIDRIGLLHTGAATERNIRIARRHLTRDPDGSAARAFARDTCIPAARVDALCLWETVPARGLPGLHRWTRPGEAALDLRLGPRVGAAFHALALNETRSAFAALPLETRPHWSGRLEQMWFRGGHADVGGQIGTAVRSRALSNIPLCWMLERAGDHGLSLPPGWRDRFPCDPDAPAVSPLSGWGKAFLLRRQRRPGRLSGEAIHTSAHAAATRHRGFAMQIDAVAEATDCGGLVMS